MKKLFNFDNPVMVVLTRIADMMILNILTLVLSIPIITIGAAFTANYYCCLKIRRDEDSGILKMYFSSFKMNFKQSTILWLIIIGAVSIPSYLLYIVMQLYANEVPTYIKVILSAAILLSLFLTAMIFPIQSRFSNSIKNTIKTSILMGVANPPRTFLIILLFVAPAYLTYNFTQLIPIEVLFGISVPAFISVLLYNKTFLKLEEKANEENGVAAPGTEDEHIFSDESEI